MNIPNAGIKNHSHKILGNSKIYRIFFKNNLFITIHYALFHPANFTTTKIKTIE